MTKFPIDAPRKKVLKTLNTLGFQTVRIINHIAMSRENPDGTTTFLSLPNHPKIKASTLRTICTQTGISRNDFLKAYNQT